MIKVIVKIITLQEKRIAFPRFFFLSDDDLLELLGQTRSNSDNREIILQSHIKKLFPGATGVTLGPNDISIIAFESHGDKLKFDQPIDIDVAVEVSNRVNQTVIGHFRRVIEHIPIKKRMY